MYRDPTARRPPDSYRHPATSTLLPPAFVSHIRESMVKIMVGTDTRHPPAFGDDRGQRPLGDGTAEGVEFRTESGGRGLPMDPSTCVFWCAIALGALVRGSPFETVSGSCLSVLTTAAKTMA